MHYEQCTIHIADKQTSRLLELLVAANKCSSFWDPFLNISLLILGALPFFEMTQKDSFIFFEKMSPKKPDIWLNRDVLPGNFQLYGHGHILLCSVFVV